MTITDIIFILAIASLFAVAGILINQKLNKIIMTLAEATAKLAALKVTADGTKTVLDTVSNKIDTQNVLIQDLKNQIANGATVPQEFVDTLAALEASINGDATAAQADSDKLAADAPVTQTTG